ncbi:MAG: methylmalonyl-CoA mutase family protein [Cyclobacteriaceae bacterium]
MNDTSNIFSGFKPLAKAEWRSNVLADLKSGDFDEQLVWNTYEDFSVQPYYAREDLKSPSLVDAPRDRTWISYQEIYVNDVVQANKEAHVALSLDVGGILFSVDKQVHISQLLKGIDLEKVEVSFSGREAIQVTRDYFDYLSNQNISPDKISGYCDHDILSKWITSGSELIYKGLEDLVKLTSKAPGFSVIHIHSGDFVNAGSNFTQELAFTMNKMVEYIDQLTEAGLTVKEVVSNISLEMATTGDFFFEIAKFQAVKNLYQSILKAYGIEEEKIPVMASGSLWSKSRYEMHVNMIRNTSEAMSAILGGCDALLVKPHDRIGRQTTAFSERIAANISNLFREESYLDKIENPASGSYYLESLTGLLIHHALDLFKQTEKDGGLVAGITSGVIQKNINEVREKKVRDLLEERFIMIGTNKYRMEGETIDVPKSSVEMQILDGRQLLNPVSLGDLYVQEKTVL